MLSCGGSALWQFSLDRRETRTPLMSDGHCSAGNGLERLDGLYIFQLRQTPASAQRPILLSNKMLFYHRIKSIIADESLRRRKWTLASKVPTECANDSIQVERTPQSGHLLLLQSSINFLMSAVLISFSQQIFFRRFSDPNASC